MFEYRINVAMPTSKVDMCGETLYQHFFRTDWIDNPARAFEAAESLRAAYPTGKVELTRRSRITDYVDF